MRVIGVDGGGTATRIALADGDGRILGIGESGPGNLHDVGPEKLAHHISEALEAAWSACGETRVALDAAFIGLASVGRETDRATVARLAAELDLAPPHAVGVDHDLRTALAGGLAGEAGIALIAGTGSSCFGRTDAGETAYAGGFGPFLDDSGSAFEMGKLALIACTRAHDGRGPATTLSSSLRDALELPKWRDLPWWWASGKLVRVEVARLARHVTAASQAGDAVAGEIVRHSAREQVTLVTTVADKLRWPDPGVATCGGLVEADGELRELVLAGLAEKLPGARTTRPRMSPVEGAVLLALELARQ